MKKVKIALAEDHTILRKGLANFINDHPKMTVIIQANNGEDLITQISSAKDFPNLCILDINMPVLNGFDTAQRIRSNWPDIKILALSMYEHEYSIINMLKRGASGYIFKSCEPDELLLAISTICIDGFYHSELNNSIAKSRLTKNNPIPHLTEKERIFLTYCCEDMSYSQIAEAMNMSLRTIDGYRDALFKKLKVSSRTGLVMFAIETGLVSFTRNS